MLLPQLCESWHWDIERVIAIMLLNPVNLLLCLKTLRFLESPDGWSWLLIYFVRHRRKAILFGTVEESALLEEE